MAIDSKRKQMRDTAKKEEEEAKRLGMLLRDDLVMGLDLSKKKPAVCILRKDTKKLVFRDHFQSSTSSFFRRTKEILIWLTEIFSLFKPKHVVLEAAFLAGRTAKSNIPLVRLHGVIGFHLFALGAIIKTIPPTSARAFLKVKPNTKEAAFNLIKKLYPDAKLENFEEDNDLSDAIVLALNIDNTENLKDF